jgi:hypothetical protein
MPEENEIKLDPWGRPEIKDYSRLYEVFGIRPFEEVIGRMNNDGIEPSAFMKRGIIFGHRDFDNVILKAIETRKELQQ